MSRRHYSSVAADTTLSGNVTNADTSFAVASLAGWPSVPFLAAFDPDDPTLQEITLVTAVSGSAVTACTRGYDGTGAQAHAPGSTLRHCVSAIEYDEANAHVNASQNVHGIGGASSVVGTATTQTLTNKTLTLPVIDQVDQSTVIALPSWSNIPLAGGNSADAGFYTPASRKQANGRVDLRGGVTLGVHAAGSATVGTLAAGFRPASTVEFVVAVGGGAVVVGRLGIVSAGVMTLAGIDAGTNSVFLDGVAFEIS